MTTFPALLFRIIVYTTGFNTESKEKERSIKLQANLSISINLKTPLSQRPSRILSADTPMFFMAPGMNIPLFSTQKIQWRWKK